MKHIQTGHYSTSGTLDSKLFLSSFDENHNLLELDSTSSIYLRIEKKGDSYFQNTYFKKKDSLLESKQFDIVIGSGVRGQSYLNWKRDSLVQLQASYNTHSQQWIHSPGYATDTIRKARIIEPRCMECHTTFVQVDYQSNGSYRYNKNAMLLGIDCERCHGPSADHVKFHQTFPDSIKAKHILKYEKLSRKQRLDMCALCHSGLRSDLILPAFTYLLGENLDNYSFAEGASATENLDVHGNQYGLLKKSKCFQKSTMDCSTCHDPHSNEREKITLFVDRCLSCHENTIKGCSMSSEQLELQKDDNCVSCHMPKLPSKTMRVQTDSINLTESVYLRTHYIAVYEDNSKKNDSLLEYIRSLR